MTDESFSRILAVKIQLNCQEEISTLKLQQWFTKLNEICFQIFGATIYLKIGFHLSENANIKGAFT